MGVLHEIFDLEIYPSPDLTSCLHTAVPGIHIHTATTATYGIWTYHYEVSKCPFLNEDPPVEY